MFMLAFYCAEWATSASMQSRDKDNIISRLHFIFLLAFQLPIRVVDENQNSRPPASFSVRLFLYYLPMQVIEDSFCGWIFNPSIVCLLVVAYTVSSRTNISLRGSFMRLSHSHWIRNAMVAGCPWASLAGIEILCLRWSEKSSSRPPLRKST